MEKGSSSSPRTGSSRTSESVTNIGTTARYVVGLIALAVIVSLAFLQEPRSDPYVENRSFADWFFEPIETNPQMRLPNAGATITSISSVPGTQTVRAVGRRGLAIISDDGGRTWRADSALIRAASIPPPARAVVREPESMPLELSAPPGEQNVEMPPATGAGDIARDNGFRIVRVQDDGRQRYGNEPFKGKEQYDPKSPNEPAKDETARKPTTTQRPPRTSPRSKPSTAETRTKTPEAADLNVSQMLVPNAAEPVIDSVRSSVTIPDYTSITHIDARNAWAAGRGGVLLRTTNGGDDWTRIDVVVGSETETTTIADLAFTGAPTGYAIDARGRMLSTRDAGATWTRASSSAAMQAVAARGSRVVAVGADQSIIEAREGSDDWRALATLSGGAALADVHVADDGADLAVGERGTLMRRTSSGWLTETLDRSVDLRAITFIDARRGMIAGDSGAAFVTTDGGATWTRARSTSTDDLTTLVAAADGDLLALGRHNALFHVSSDASEWQRLVRPLAIRISYAFSSIADGLSITEDGMLERTTNGGLSWARTAAPADARIVDVAIADGGNGVAVGDDIVLTTSDRGATWSRRRLPRAMMLTDVVLNDRSAWAIGPGPTIVRSDDGGASWREVNGSVAAPREVVDATLRPSRGLDAIGVQRAWVVTGDTIRRTTDGGATWRRSLAPLARTGDIDFVGENLGWIACGSSVWRTSDAGATWKAYGTPADGRLVGICFTDSANGIAVGELGGIVATKSSGHKWERRAPPQSTNDMLISASEAGGDLVAAGALGTVLTSSSDGLTWRQPEYSWLPAPWFYAALIALLALAYALRRKPEEAGPALTIADILANDRPLEAGEHDALDLGSRAMHLSYFIRNKKTEPPMTFAVTGRWGSGKSSLMNLLKTDLVRHGHRPVWFNAWHHQGEQHLLAALFENVRRQAIPPIADINGVRFRARLLLGRLRRFGPWLAPAFLMFAVAAGYLLARPDEPQRVMEFIGGLVDKVTSFLTAETSEELPTAPDFGGTAAFSVLAGSFIALLNLTFRGLMAFGIAPAVMLRKFSDGAKLKDLQEMTGFRYKFQREFEEVTNALRDTTMVIIIDDLDRCQPENVLEVLEAVNFLVSSGRVHVILGMDKQRVLDYVRKGYQEEGPEFADRYMQKLINVEISIPPPSPAAARSIVDTDTLEKHARILETRRRVERRLRGARTLVTFLLIASIGLPVYWLAHQRTADLSSAPASVAAAPTVAIDTSRQIAGVSPADDSTSSALQYDAIRSTRDSVERAMQASMIPVASLSSGDDGTEPWVPFGIPLALFAIVVSLSLADRPSSNLTDSREFGAALDTWLPVITAVDNTPRSLKRFVNHVRFLAMQGRVAQADPTLWEKLVDKCCREKLPPRTSATTAIRDAHVVAIEAARFLTPNATITEEWFGPSGPGPIAASGDGSTDGLASLVERARRAHIETWGPVEFEPDDLQPTAQKPARAHTDQAQTDARDDRTNGAPPA